MDRCVTSLQLGQYGWECGGDAGNNHGDHACVKRLISTTLALYRATSPKLSSPLLSEHTADVWSADVVMLVVVV